MAFIVALNIALQFDEPDVPTAYFQSLTGESGNPELFQSAVQEASQRLTDDQIARTRAWSLAAIFALALASGIGGYIVSGIMLRPIRDITEVAAEINTMNLSQRIDYRGPDDELKALADTFDSMITRLETSFSQQSQFVQDASHELRTPLAAIRTNIDVLEMTGDGTVEEYRELVETIRTQTDRLARLTEDLLLLARNEQDSVEVETVPIRELTHEVMRELQPLADRKDVKLIVDAGDELWVNAVPSMLYRCVLNLTDNAIKYSGDGATVWLRSTQAGNRVSISVADNGPGIPAELQGAVFSRFYRIDRGRSRREGGSGLGLAIVKQLVEMQRGTISLHSEVGAGTTFTLTFPLATDLDASYPLNTQRPHAGTF